MSSSFFVCLVLTEEAYTWDKNVCPGSKLAGNQYNHKNWVPFMVPHKYLTDLNVGERKTILNVWIWDLVDAKNVIFSNLTFLWTWYNFAQFKKNNKTKYNFAETSNNLTKSSSYNVFLICNYTTSPNHFYFFCTNLKLNKYRISH